MIGVVRCGRCRTRRNVQLRGIINYATGRVMRVRVCDRCFAEVYL